MSKLYMNKEETKALTDAVIAYNKENNPIKIFNGCFDYYVETYNDKPIYNSNWVNIIDIRKDFEYKKIDKSINRMIANDKLKDYDSKNFDDIKNKRREEINEYISKVLTYDPADGKLKIKEIPYIIYSSIDTIAKNYVENYKFYGYVYKEDLKMSAIEKCLRYLSGFSGVSSNNAFSYFTTIIGRSFLETIKKEYNYSNIKAKLNTRFYEATSDEQCEMQENYNGNA